jgi:hypothetical protein
MHMNLGTRSRREDSTKKGRRIVYKALDTKEQWGLKSEHQDDYS